MAYNKSSVNKILRDNKSYVLHVSTIAKVPPGEGRPLRYFPHDLDCVIYNAKLEIACCAMPISAGTLPDINTLGAIGVVLQLNSDESLLAVHYSDMGSSAEDGGEKRIFDKMYIPKDCCQITKSIVLRKIKAVDEDGNGTSVHNEWVVTDYTACAILMLSDPAIATVNEGGPVHVGSEFIKGRYPGLPIIGPLGSHFIMPEEFSTDKLYI